MLTDAYESLTFIEVVIFNVQSYGQGRGISRSQASKPRRPERDAECSKCFECRPT